jgi:hypothetical protein
MASGTNLALNDNQRVLEMRKRKTMRATGHLRQLLVLLDAIRAVHSRQQRRAPKSRVHIIERSSITQSRNSTQFALAIMTLTGMSTTESVVNVDLLEALWLRTQVARRAQSRGKVVNSSGYISQQKLVITKIHLLEDRQLGLGFNTTLVHLKEKKSGRKKSQNFFLKNFACIYRKNLTSAEIEHPRRLIIRGA